MKKKIIIYLIIAIFLIIIFATFKINSKETVVIGKDYLYDKIEEYIIKQEEQGKSKMDIFLNDYKIFTDISKLGIKQNKEETYVYAWIIVESYYVQYGHLKQYSGSSMPYKFILKNDEVVDYKVPRDGEEYSKSIKEIFPIDVRFKINNINVNNKKIKEKLKKHYLYLNETSIYTDDYIDIVPKDNDIE